MSRSGANYPTRADMQWSSFVAEVLHGDGVPEPSREELQELKRVFYSGMAGVIDILLTEIKSKPETTYSQDDVQEMVTRASGGIMEFFNQELQEIAAATAKE